MTTEKICEVYSKGCQDGPTKVRKSVNVNVNVTKTAKFTIILLSIYDIYKVL